MAQNEQETLAWWRQQRATARLRAARERDPEFGLIDDSRDREYVGPHRREVARPPPEDAGRPSIRVPSRELADLPDDEPAG